jgi:hypothetical protein
VAVTIVLPYSIRQQLAQHARESHQSFSAVIRRRLRHFEECDLDSRPVTDERALAVQ